MSSFILFATLILYSVLAFTGGGTEIELPIKGKKAIELCMMEYAKLAGQVMPDEIDRVYIDVFQNGYSLLFSSAVGTFGKRSLHYQSFLVCFTSGGEVSYLGAPMRDALIGKPELNTFENYEEEVTELLYKKVDHQFEYCCSQQFDEKILIKIILTSRGEIKIELSEYPLTSPP